MPKKNATSQGKKKVSKNKPKSKTPELSKNTTIIVRPPDTSRSRTPKFKKPDGATLAAICGLVDPFCEHAVGVKYPDKSASRTLAYSQHFKGLMATDGAGNTSNLFLPGFSYGTAVGVVAGLNVTYSALATNPTTGVVPSFYRIVSMGIRLRSPVAPLNASGMVYIRGYPTQTGVSLGSLNMAQYNTDFSMDIPLSAINNNGHTDIIFRKTDDITACTFADPATTNPAATVSSWVAPGFGAVNVGVSGGPLSISVLDVEFFIHYELMFDDFSSLGLMATPSKPVNDALTSIASQVSHAVGNVFNEVTQDVGTVVRGVARQAMMNAVRTYGPAIIGPLMLV